MLLAGCGGTDTAMPAAPSVTVAESSSSVASEPVPEQRPGGRGTWDTSGPSFGVDRVVWPAGAEGAYELLVALPPTFRGEALDTYYSPAEEEYGASAGAQYGQAQSITVRDEYVSSDTESGKPELFTADQLLAATFGLVYGCDEKTYRGTIEPLEGGFAPGYGSSPRSSEPRWFSCRIDGAEGDDNFKGHAVGWTSKRAAWLVVAEDEKAARSLIANLEAPDK